MRGVRRARAMSRHSSVRETREWRLIARARLTPRMVPKLNEPVVSELVRKPDDRRSANTDLPCQRLRGMERELVEPLSQVLDDPVVVLGEASLRTRYPDDELLLKRRPWWCDCHAMITLFRR